MDNPCARINITDMDADILITGGGLNGCGMALAAASGGLTVALIDSEAIASQKSDGFDGRSYAIARGSQRMLEAIGLWSALAETSGPIMEIKVSDGQTGRGPGPFSLGFDQAEIEDGPMGFMVEDRHLRPVLLEAVAAHPNITHYAGTRVVAQTAGQTATVTLDTGATLSGMLLIGADGVQGQTAARAGIRKMEWGYGQIALVCALETELPHNCIAHQLFLPPGPLAVLPLKGNRVSIVWSENAETAAAFASLNDTDYLAALHTRLGDFLGEVSLTGARYTYPLGLSLARSFVADRAVLIGDAAHRMHPIAGQGLNVGLRDIAALAEVLVDARRRGEDIGSLATLQRYQSWRRFDTTALAFATDGFNRLFSNNNPLLRLGRGLGLSMVGKLPDLRRSFIREAAGLTGDLPRLARGLPL